MVQWTMSSLPEDPMSFTRMEFAQSRRKIPTLKEDPHPRWLSDEANMRCLHSVIIEPQLKSPLTRITCEVLPD